MKVKVIDVTGAARDLAIGKVYEVVRQKENGNFVIISESGREVSFKASRFEVVSEVITFKVGDILKDNNGDKYILVHDHNMVALASFVNGAIDNGFHFVQDLNCITEEEMSIIDSDYNESPLEKVTGCGC